MMRTAPARMRACCGAASAKLRRRAMILPALLALGACTATTTSFDPTGNQDPDFIEELPADVAALAGPNQDLQSVTLRPEDGCYWYLYEGPVETTMIPLRTAGGQRICARAQNV